MINYFIFQMISYVIGDLYKIVLIVDEVGKKWVVYEERGGGCCILPYLSWIILNKYRVIVDGFIIEVIREGTGPPFKAIPISASKEGEGNIFGCGTLLW